MIRPNSSEIEALAKDYKIIPISKEIYADITTPIAVLRKLAAISKNYFLLESVVGGEKWGRYSFLGFDPLVSISCKDKKLVIKNRIDCQKQSTEKRVDCFGQSTANENRQEIHTDKPFDYLRELMKEYKAPRLQNLPPFAGGLVGYFSYGLFAYAEPVLKIRSSDFNDFELKLFDKVIAYDHLKQKIIIIVNMKTDRVLENYGRAVADIERLTRLLLDTPAESAQIKVMAGRPAFSCNVSREDYCRMVEKTKEYIKDGDIFQAVISRRFQTSYTDSLLNAYRVLRTTNPSPYMVFMQYDDLQLISTSPETLIRLKDGKLVTMPIAGSRPRGKDPQEDRKLEEELLADNKELAEHDMLVDLARNDLGRISDFGTVKVTDYRRIHSYLRIMHITSEVEGQLKKDKDAFDAIVALLPAGTLSGAPKIRACQIIEELEPEPRGIYGGAIGYIDFTGNMDTCIAIRMAVKKDDKVYIQAGAGIVADSNPQKEYEESENKAKAIIEAIIKASEVDE